MTSTTASRTASIKPSIKACVICGAPLAGWQPAGDILCRFGACASRHASLPAAFKCQHCAHPLPIRQRGLGHCDDPICRDEVLRERREAEAARHLALLARLRRRRARSAAQRGIPPEEQATYRLAIIPRNTDRVSQLPSGRRARHEAHLRGSLTSARERLAAGEQSAPGGTVGPTDHRAPELQRAEERLLLAACSACRGHCCRLGGDHAFNTAETMMGYLERRPTLDDDAVVADYMQHVGDRTMTHGCIYQGERGCTLSPDLRADVCHHFHCSGLLMLKGKLTDGDPVRAYLVHHRDDRVTGDRFVQISATERAPTVRRPTG